MRSVKDILFSGLGMGMGALAYYGSQAPILDSDSGASIAPAALDPLYQSSAPSCPIDGPLSCHNSTAVKNDCCFIYPGGQLLLTQFWDTRPSIGPSDSWTLHGLWYVIVDVCLLSLLLRVVRLLIMGRAPSSSNSCPFFSCLKSTC